MSRTFNVGDARAQLSHLIARAKVGEVMIVARDGVPVARIVAAERPISETIALMRRERGQRPPVSAADVFAAKERDRA